MRYALLMLGLCGVCVAQHPEGIFKPRMETQLPPYGAKFGANLLVSPIRGYTVYVRSDMAVVGYKQNLSDEYCSRAVILHQNGQTQFQMKDDNGAIEIIDVPQEVVHKHLERFIESMTLEAKVAKQKK